MRRLTTTVALSVLLGGAADPRPALIELQLDNRLTEAVDQTRQLLASNTELSREWGLEYLEGHLLERLQQTKEAPIHFANAMTSTPRLASYSRYRLALHRYRAGDSEAAAGLLANLLTHDPPSALVPVATRWLVLAIQNGGDCALLDSRGGWPLDASARRLLQAAVVDCAIAAGDTEEIRSRMRALLEESYTDETARRAAHGLAILAPDGLDSRTTLLVGQALFHQREFAQAIPFLVDSLDDVAAATQGRRRIDRADILYLLARSHYWKSQFASAARTFQQSALEETDDGKRARALFQRGRSFALLGDWDTAVESYREAASTAPTDSWAGAALLAAMRLEWRQDREDSALQLLSRLRARRSWWVSLERAALFLAVSDVVRGRSDRAGQWLDLARQARRHDGPENRYWRGRLAELEDRRQEAVQQYTELLAMDSLHPLAVSAKKRLQGAELEPARQEAVERLGASNRTADLLRAWLLAREDPRAPEIEQALASRFRKARRTRPYVEMQAQTPSDWILWRQSVRLPEELLLTLGIAETNSSALRRAFPLDDTGLALAGSRLLTASGLHHRSLYFAEVVSKRLPSGLPHQFLPESFRRLLYPRPYAYRVAQQSSRFGVDPDLLTAIMREESRFDPMAVSAASARGLTQFVTPTAQRLAAKLDWQALDARDLHQPEVAITLGATYLAELSKRFSGRTEQMVAAYNAGEELARLWQAYCFSREPEEYFSKVGFRQTRGYLEKVLTGRAYYAEVYGDEGDRASALLSTESTRGGSESKLLSK